jgi:hypothetical protein
MGRKSTRVYFKCENCGKDHSIILSEYKKYKRHFCSNKCLGEFRHNNHHLFPRKPFVHKCKYDWSNLANDLNRLKSIAALAKEYGCPKQTLKKHLKKQGIKFEHDRLNSPDKNVRFSRIAELHALKILPGAVDMNELYNNSYPYDILWHNQKINVKASYNPKQQCWYFSTKKGFGKCDYYLFMLYKGEFLFKAYYVPASLINVATVTISPSGRFSDYLIFSEKNIAV